MNCFRYLGFTDVRQVDRMTIREYELVMKAAKLKQVDEEYKIHLLAFANQRARAEKKVGKGKTRPVYTRFNKFYDYKKELETVSRTKRKERFAAAKAYMRQKGG